MTEGAGMTCLVFFISYNLIYFFNQIVFIKAGYCRFITVYATSSSFFSGIIIVLFKDLLLYLNL